MYAIRSYYGKLAIDPAPLLIVMGLCMLAAAGAVALLVRLYSRRLESEINKAISAADLRTPLELAIPELVTIAKQLRRATLRALRQGSASAGPSDLPQPEVATLPRHGADLTNPIFQSVITSYSIHYTKLYESISSLFARPRPSMPWWGGRVICPR